MTRARIALLALVLGLNGSVVLGTLQERRNANEMADAARSFLASLSGGRRPRAAFPFESKERLRHHFIPPETFERRGLVFKQMSSEQKVRALVRRSRTLAGIASGLWQTSA